MTKDEIQAKFTYMIVTVDNEKHVEMSLEEFDRISSALQSPSDKRLQGHIDYSIDLQRIIESLCHGEEIIKPKTTARHHYDMAVAYKAAIQSPRAPVIEGLDEAISKVKHRYADEGYIEVTNDDILTVLQAARWVAELQKGV